jgi:hypothetical protein
VFDEEETGKKVSDSEPSVKLTLLLVVCAFSQQRKTPKLLFFRCFETVGCGTLVPSDRAYGS